jgi:hypothetical protein
MLVKVVIPIEQDEDGFPPFTSEGVWAKPVGDGCFEVANAPFYAYGISLGDVVAARPAGQGEFELEDVVEASGHSLVRVKVRARGVEDDEVDRRVTRWRSALDAIGCGSELSNLRTLFSVDVPAAVDYGPVRARLDEGAASGEIGFEEANLRHAV